MLITFHIREICLYRKIHGFEGRRGSKSVSMIFQDNLLTKDVCGILYNDIETQEEN